jgi:hypothetical protein
MHRSIALVALLALPLAAATPKKSAAPKPVAPDSLPHSIALFLKDLSKDGKRQISFRASASGTYFFFSESAGVTVYHFTNGQYVRAEFVRGASLAAALRKYQGKR